MLVYLMAKSIMLACCSNYSYFVRFVLYTWFFTPFYFQAYDQHLNMILGDVEEIITTVEIDDETYEEIVRVSKLL